MLFFLVQSTRNPVRLSWWEVIFCIYTFGWILDQLASLLEHGWNVYSENLWSFLDVIFSVIFMGYVILRFHGLQTDTNTTSQAALDILALGAPFLIPRLAFNLFSENLLFVSLREMMARFLLLTLLAVWTFAGFFLAMYWLAESKRSPATIGKWMVWVWFGLDGTGIQRSVEFHWFFGPLLMIAFAVFGNTLFLTILVSTLSHTFSRINRSATAEVQFRKAVLTFEGVKSDALFAYQPPFNLVALIVLLPLRFLLTPRWFHKVHVHLVRTLNAPILYPICLYERRYLWPKGSRHTSRKHRQSRSARIGNSYFSRFNAHRNIVAVFDADPPPEHSNHLTFEEPNLPPRDRRSKPIGSRATSAVTSTGTSTERDWMGSSPSGPGPRRRTSAWSVGGIEDHVADLLRDQDSAGSGDVAKRLEKLEKSNVKIETLLKRICDSLENGTDDEPGQDDAA